MGIEVVNPTTGEHVRSYEEMSPDEVREVVAAAHEAHLTWRRAPFSSARSS